MSCELPKPVASYLDEIDSGVYRVSEEQKAFSTLVRRVFREEDLNVDGTLFDNYMRLLKYFPYGRLYPWEECQFFLWNCVFRTDGLPRWDTVFDLLGRGAGKDGFIAFDALCMVSPYNPAKAYNVDICANNEDQAMQPVRDILDVLELPQNEEKLKRFYYHTKEIVQGRTNKGTIIGHTNNPKGRDGLRSGKVILNEVHQYQNYDNITVFTTGLGKKEHPRMGIFTSNGNISDGPLDDYDARSKRILFEGEDDRGFLPFICRVQSKEQIDDRENWTMANPSLRYNATLSAEIEREYEDWKANPEQNPDFVVKRFGIREGIQELAVTDYENIRATNRPLPDMTRWSCTVGVDYAELSDWAAVNIHFRRGCDRFDINHAWLCEQSKTLHRIKAPWKDWARMGHLTVVNDVSIPAEMLTEYIRQMGTRYTIRCLAMDNFRWPLLADAFTRIGFDARDRNRVRLVKTQDIMKVDPVIQECFSRGYFAWGDNPVLRWAANNTKRVRSSRSIGSDTGNFYYAKIEAKSRKTDPFMALAASMTVEDVLGSGTVSVPSIGAITF